MVSLSREHHDTDPPTPVGGVRLTGKHGRQLQELHWQTQAYLKELGLLSLADVQRLDNALGPSLLFKLPPALQDHWTPGHDTSRLCTMLGLDTRHADDLTREIVLSMLASPEPLIFPGLPEWQAAISVRKHIVQSARATVIANSPGAPKHPLDHWCRDDQRDYALRPGRSLIAALQKTTQPAPGAHGYALSGSRATEYVILLSIATEAQRRHPQLYARLQRQTETRPLQTSEFRRMLMRQLGSSQAPVPALFYVPGDRVWFCNPHAPSAQVGGYEGAWCIYLGQGKFSDFRQSGQPLSLTERCLEIYHWRDGLWLDPDGQPHIDEDEVARRVRQTWDNPQGTQDVLSNMLQWHGVCGTQPEGGCLDPAREFPRQLCPGTCDMVLPLN
jgi:hypothetical protein